VLGGLTIHPPVANFLRCTVPKIMTIERRQSWALHCSENRVQFFGPLCIGKWWRWTQANCRRHSISPFKLQSCSCLATCI